MRKVDKREMRKAVNRQANKQAGTSPNPLSVPSGVAKLCAPEFHLVGASMREAYATRLGSVYLPGDTRRMSVRRIFGGRFGGIANSIRSLTRNL
ncbi:hypothetical protein CDL15_Pgr002607 [Punica granatum]|uniref:Uncharacterized protein n=1 Tax=Punica granatum TaxID=22663 RepID=A0A218WKF7_PUNGR|nr:hypothetical protein CDL15_Pgr002607 [Punica granatum]